MRKIIVSPSLLSANFSKLKEELDLTKECKAEWLHYDVMDGHFVPNISFGYGVLKSIKPYTDLFMDVHLMISEPLKYVENFVKSGADLITIHYESYDDKSLMLQTINKIKELGVKVGVSIKPNTDVKVLDEYLSMLDLVLVMSVEPGFGGQSFMPSALDKIAYLRKMVDENNYQLLIEVDGGINHETGKLCRDAGVDVLVAGSYLYGKEDFAQRVAGLKGE